jgi:glutathione reductase (NADPH)
MPDYDFDLFTIGGGSGGVRGARIAASYGAKVAIAEEGAWGGTCVNVGCIPKKLFVYASHFHEDLEDARAYGWNVTTSGFEWPHLLANKNKEIARLNGIYTRILDKAGVEVIEGRARLVDAHTVEVNGKKITAKYILVAVGGKPRTPPWPGSELCITSNEAFHLEQLPKRVVVCGGGYIATEFTGIYHGLSVDVTQLYRGELFMRGFDVDVREHLAEQMRNKGIDLRFNNNIARVDKSGDRIVATLADESRIECDQVLVAIGRVPLTGDLGLESAGIKTDDAGAIVVDDYGKTNIDSIYAAGDVTNRIQLTPVALAEGMAIAATLFDDRPTKPDHENVASAVFSQPPIGTVGITEAEARQRGEVVIYRSVFRTLKDTLTGRDAKTLMKLCVDKKTDKVVGVHMVGPGAGEIIQGFSVAMKMGATKKDLDRTIGIHPTAAEEFVSMRTPVSS